MRRVLPALALTVLLAPVAAMGQSNPALWRFVDPNAKALIGIDWGRIRPLQAGAMIREQWLTASAVGTVPGLDLLDEIDRVLISSPGKNSSDDSAESPILIAIHGHFDAAKVRQVFTHLGAKPQAYNSFQVYRPQGKDPRSDDPKDTAWVLFDAETILYGDARSIFAALDRNQFAQASPQPTAASGSILARSAEMDARYELWMIMDATEMMSSDRIAALFRGGEWASEAQALEAGFDLRTGLAADITVRFSSDTVAKRVTAELTRAMNLAAKDRSAGAQAQNIAKKMKFNVDGSAAKVSLRLTVQELEQSALAFAASQKEAAADAGLSEKSNEKSNTNAAAVAVPQTTPPKRGVIRIEGLDEGTREIPYQEPRH
jgi:hypothetical protein